jgi:Ca2+/Na+ antiporter
MSKVFTDEYKKLAEKDLPDLWERIEAGLAEKQSPATLEATHEDIPANPQAIKLETLSYRNRYSFLRRYGGLIAACLCAAVIIPVVYFNRGIVSENYSAESPAAAAPAVPAPAAPAPAAEAAAPAAEAAMPAEEPQTTDSFANTDMTPATEAAAGEIAQDIAADEEMSYNTDINDNNKTRIQRTQEAQSPEAPAPQEAAPLPDTVRTEELAESETSPADGEFQTAPGTIVPGNATAYDDTVLEAPELNEPDYLLAGKDIAADGEEQTGYGFVADAEAPLISTEVSLDTEADSQTGTSVSAPPLPIIILAIALIAAVAIIILIIKKRKKKAD